MADLNSVALTGRLTAEPEIKTLGADSKVANFSIAVNEYRKGDPNAVSFISIAAWNSTADVVEKYLHKGSQVAIKGRMSQSRWEKDGKKQSKIQINCESLTLLGGKPKAEESAPVEVSKQETPW